MAYEFDWDAAKEKAEKVWQWIYWIVGLALIGTISYVLYNRFNKQVAGVLVFMAGMMALYFYYVKWFIVASDTTWPPVISACPDFLTQLPIQSANTTYCVDYVGVSTESGGLEAATGNNFVAPTTETDAKNSSKVFSFNPTAADLCQTVKEKGLTWVALCDMA